MSNRVYLSAAFDFPPGEGGFSYDQNRPTFYTEFLSYGIGMLLARAGQAGGYIDFGDASDGNDAQAVLFDGWVTEMKAWLTDVGEKVSAWIVEPDGSRALPAIPAAPLLMLPAGAAVMMSKALVIKAAIDIGATAIKVYTQTVSNIRAARTERMLDKSLNRESWFSDGRPYLMEISDTLQSLKTLLQTKEVDGSDIIGLAEVLQRGVQYRILDVDGNAIYKGGGAGEALQQIVNKLGTQGLRLEIFLDTRGTIDTVEFG